MISRIKTDLVKKLLESGLVKPYDIIEHSFTDNGVRDISRCIISQDGIFPTMTTRPDCLGVVVDEKP